MKDWTGNKKTTFATLGASNHAEHDRAENDFYATDPLAIDWLCSVEKFEGYIWENAVGQGHLAKRLKELGYVVIGTDLVDRGYGRGHVDFLKCEQALASNIITNPPYSLAKEWVEHSLSLLPTGGKLALFLPIQFLEGEKRRSLFEENPPKKIYVCVNRILCGINGDFFMKDKDGNNILDKSGNPKRMSSAKCYAWFVWVKGYKGEITLDFIPKKDK